MSKSAILDPRESEQACGGTPPGGAGDEVMRRRVTQSDLARLAGVHNTTVSMALRNNPSISEETRKRIQDLAQKMGYRPDPTLCALIAYRNDIMADRRMETLAYITNGETQWGWRSMPSQEQMFLGAKRRAAAAGYQLEHFWLGSPNLSSRRLGEMLFHRGIRGVLLGYDPMQWETPPAFDWEQFSTVGVGWKSRSLRIHRVMNDPEEAMSIAFQNCLTAGRRRPGLLLPAQWDMASRKHLISAFRRTQAFLSECGQVPVFSVEKPVVEAEKAEEVARMHTEALLQWFRSQEPDVILGCRSDAFERLSACGLRIPGDVAFVDLFKDESTDGVAGVRQGSERAGEIAVELLMNQLQLNIRGLPQVPTSTLVESLWSEGKTLPALDLGAWSRGKRAPGGLVRRQCAGTAA